VTGDAGAGDDVEVLMGEFEAGDDADIGGSGGHLVGAGSGNAEIQLEKVLLGSVEHAPD
jgi:hypothetical protein